MYVIYAISSEPPIFKVPLEVRCCDIIYIYIYISVSNHIYFLKQRLIITVRVSQETLKAQYDRIVENVKATLNQLNKSELEGDIDPVSRKVLDILADLEVKKQNESDDTDAKAAVKNHLLTHEMDWIHAKTLDAGSASSKRRRSNSTASTPNSVGSTSTP